ncbi:MAG: TrkH family potassium uptake protein [Lachnospiraceae bacterium]
MKKMSATTKILLGFLVTILIGALLLMLPISSVEGDCDFLTALFTATTSVCVTGLVVVPTYSYWTLFGKIVILILIQLGGLGIVALTTGVMLVLNRRISLKDNLTIQNAFGLDNLRNLSAFVKHVIQGTLLIEFVGGCLYMIAFVPKYGVRGIWYSFFNAISAFCNAGIDILGPDSLMQYQTSPLVLFTTMLMIVSGGIGFVVWRDFLHVARLIHHKQIKKRDYLRNLTTHTKVVLTTTLFLIVLGFLATLLFEFNNPETLGNLSFGNKLLNSLFQSVTYRTAGFAAISQAGLTEASVLLGNCIMLIGGSPVGTAGGIKTVTAAVIVYTVIAVIKGQNETLAFRKSIYPDLIRRSISVTMISFAMILIFSILLMLTNDLSMTDSTFEVVSAIATVGLSRDITPTLNTFGKICIIICMYLGRIGPISMFIFFGQKASSKNAVHHAQAKIMVG